MAHIPIKKSVSWGLLWLPGTSLDCSGEEQCIGIYVKTHYCTLLRCIAHGCLHHKERPFLGHRNVHVEDTLSVSRLYVGPTRIIQGLLFVSEGTAFGGTPYGATIFVRGVPNCARCLHASAATGAFGGAPHGAAILVRGVPKWARVRHSGAATLAFGEAPYGATIFVRAVPKRGAAMRALPLWPSMELPMGPRKCEGRAVLGKEDACDRGHWGLRWSSLRGYEALC